LNCISESFKFSSLPSLTALPVGTKGMNNFKNYFVIWQKYLTEKENRFENYLNADFNAKNILKLSGMIF